MRLIYFTLSVLICNCQAVQGFELREQHDATRTGGLVGCGSQHVRYNNLWGCCRGRKLISPANGLPFEAVLTPHFLQLALASTPSSGDPRLGTVPHIRFFHERELWTSAPHDPRRLVVELYSLSQLHELPCSFLEVWGSTAKSTSISSRFNSIFQGFPVILMFVLSNRPFFSYLDCFFLLVISAGP
jgi:hypothetical protein